MTFSGISCILSSSAAKIYLHSCPCLNSVQTIYSAVHLSYGSPLNTYQESGYKVNLDTYLPTEQSLFKPCCPSQIRSCPTVLMIQILPLCSVQKLSTTAPCRTPQQITRESIQSVILIKWGYILMLT